jgi:tRNA nucleotidyltransferase (CCA-adding enzyme)
VAEATPTTGGPRQAGAGALASEGAGVLEKLRTLPGGAELLRLARGREDAALVGGAVRDLLIGSAPRELDVVVGGEASAFAQELAAALAAEGAGELPTARVHERFGTASVERGTARIDIAERRAEAYRSPGALPEVRPGSIDEDLRRRDFTVNAISVSLGGPQRGAVQAVERAVEDLAGGLLRVLHERSFIDDPTRLLRLARYRARLGFDVEERTAALAGEALRAGAVNSISGARSGGELRLALQEADPLGALAAMHELGVLSAIDRSLDFDSELACTALELLPEDARADVVLVASLLLRRSSTAEEQPQRRISELLDRLEFTAAVRERITSAARLAPVLAIKLRCGEQVDRSVRADFSAHTPETIALAGALAEPGSRERTTGLVREWFQSGRHVRLAITGEDLLAAGIAEGPEIGRRLELALRKKLEGELPDDRDCELRAALEAEE